MREGDPQPDPRETARISLPLGRLLATPGALHACEEAGAKLQDYIVRHARGDWGEVDAEDRAANDWSVTNQARVLSAYTLLTGVRIWIITEADRSATTALLPEEY